MSSRQGGGAKAGVDNNTLPVTPSANIGGKSNPFVANQSTRMSFLNKLTSRFSRRSIQKLFLAHGNFCSVVVNVVVV